MYVNQKKNEAEQAGNDNPSISKKSDNDQQETVISTSLDNNEVEDFVEKKSKFNGLSEKFFLSDLADD